MSNDRGAPQDAFTTVISQDSQRISRPPTPESFTLVDPIPGLAEKAARSAALSALSKAQTYLAIRTHLEDAIARLNADTRNTRFWGSRFLNRGPGTKQYIIEQLEEERKLAHTQMLEWSQSYVERRIFFSTHFDEEANKRLKTEASEAKTLDKELLDKGLIPFEFDDRPGPKPLRERMEERAREGMLRNAQAIAQLEFPTNIVQNQTLFGVKSLKDLKASGWTESTHREPGYRESLRTVMEEYARFRNPSNAMLFAFSDARRGASVAPSTDAVKAEVLSPFSRMLEVRVAIEEFRAACASIESDASQKLDSKRQESRKAEFDQYEQRLLAEFGQHLGDFLGAQRKSTEPVPLGQLLDAALNKGGVKLENIGRMIAGEAKKGDANLLWLIDGRLDLNKYPVLRELPYLNLETLTKSSLAPPRLTKTGQKATDLENVLSSAKRALTAQEGSRAAASLVPPLALLRVERPKKVAFDGGLEGTTLAELQAHVWRIQSGEPTTRRFSLFRRISTQGGRPDALGRGGFPFAHAVEGSKHRGVPVAEEVKGPQVFDPPTPTGKEKDAHPSAPSAPFAPPRPLRRSPIGSHSGSSHGGSSPTGSSASYSPPTTNREELARRAHQHLPASSSSGRSGSGSGGSGSGKTAL